MSAQVNVQKVKEFIGKAIDASATPGTTANIVMRKLMFDEIMPDGRPVENVEQIVRVANLLCVYNPQLRSEFEELKIPTVDIWKSRHRSMYERVGG